LIKYFITDYNPASKKNNTITIFMLWLKQGTSLHRLGFSKGLAQVTCLFRSVTLKVM